MSEDKKNEDIDIKNPEEKSEPFSVSSSRNPVQRSINFTIPPLPNIRNLSFSKNDKRTRAGLLVALFIVITMLSGFSGAWIESRVNPNGLVTTGSLSNQ